MFVKKSISVLSILVIALAFLALSTNSAHAAPVDRFPLTITQPDGTQVSLFASGDEFYNWLQDAQGFTVLPDPTSGYYVYADLLNGALVPTQFIAGRDDPASAGLSPFLNISSEKKNEIRQARLSQSEFQPAQIQHGPTTGTVTNLVVFIRFAGETEFTTTTSTYTTMLNSSTAGVNSLYNYFREVSYNKLTISSNLYPSPGATILSYSDSHARSYFQPYNAATNPNGYSTTDNGVQAKHREDDLLRAAILYVNGLGQFPSGAVIDADGDGYVDGMTFVISGSPGGWADLLWPHQWEFYPAFDGYTVSINGKAVGVYNFQMQTMTNTAVLAHEMFHVIGAPDLYHYTNQGVLQTVGNWDVMESTNNPPEHMGCFMKYKYGTWISSIPELTGTGSITVQPSTWPTANCFKIKSPNSASEYFVVEYRVKTGTFESSLPGSGLLVYRINTLAGDGNADGPPDEVYVYRPGGTTTVNGLVNSANFSSNVGRTAINDSTNPSSFLSNGAAGGLNISNVGAAGATISFNYSAGAPVCYALTRDYTGSGSQPTASPTNSTGCSAGQYTAGQAITLSATPASGFNVGSWSGTDNDASTSTSNSVTMPAAIRTVTVNYTSNTIFALNVSKSGAGTVTSNPAGIDCGATCSYAYPANTVVTLSASPTAPYTFGSWSGAGCSGTGSCIVTMSSIQNVVATFLPGSTDDNYEENDTLATAYDLSNYEQTWLSAINGFGIQADADFYRIYITPGYDRLIVDLRFTHALGDIDIDLLDDAGNYITGSAGVSDNEYINTIVPASGVYYYLVVYYGNAGNQYDLWWDDLLPVTNGGIDTTGVFRPSNGLLYLKHANTSGWADVAINYGTAGDYPVAGDWDGDGISTIGIYRNGYFYLRNSNTLGFADIFFPFGAPGDQPVVGDWDGDGIDTIGVFRYGTFYLRNNNSAGAPDVSFALGNPGDVGIAGDFDGDGLDTTGVFRPSNGVIFLKNSNTSGFADVALNYGLAGDKPVIGDWDGNGTDTIGIYRNATFYLRNSNTNGFADLVFALGNPGDMPIAGNWDGSIP